VTGFPRHQGERPGAARPESRRDEPFAAIDLGTNNCRLLVARPARDGFRVVDAFSRIVRLGEGLGGSGRLSEAAMQRAVEALGVCADKIRRRRVRQYRAVATEACRRAANRHAFAARVAQETGIELEIIDQAEEARLALSGCMPLLRAGAPNALVFDIGGGSTEVIWLRIENGDDGPDDRRLRIADWYSMPIGVVGLAERHGGHDIDDEVYRRMIRESAEALTPFACRPDVREALAGGEVQMIGTSGTVTTLAGVYQGLPRYDRRRVDGCYLSFETVQTVSRRIAAMSYRERVRHPCIGDQRADLVSAGCAILEAICETWPVGRLRVADRGLREGMLLQMMGRAEIPTDAPQPAVRDARTA